MGMVRVSARGLAATLLLTTTVFAQQQAPSEPAPGAPAERHAVAMVERSASHGPTAGASNASAVRAAFPPGQQAVELPFRLVSNKIIVPVRVNSQGPFDFVLDTGATSALFDAPEAAESLDVEIVGRAMVAGAGNEGPKPIDLARNVTFDVGGMTLTGAQLAITPAGGPPLMPGSDWQGVFGDQLFTSTVVEIDWQQERLVLHDPQHYVAPSDVVAVPLRVAGGHVYVDATVVTEGEVAKTLELVVDTGANHALSLAPSAGKRPSRKIADTTLGYGLSGPLRGDVGRVRSLRLGETTLYDVLTNFPAHQLSTTIHSGVDGNLGAEVLRRFDTIFDYANERMLLRATPNAGSPFSFSTSGIYVRPWLDDRGHAVVGDVLADSPAARAGIAEGDRIVAVGGQPMASLTLDDLRTHLSGKPGATLALTLMRDGDQLERSLALEELL